MSDVYQRVGYVNATMYHVRRDGAGKVVPFDAIVVERSELPEVEDDFNLYEPTLDNASRASNLRATARKYLAKAEYLDANPPVDESQVSALAQVMREALSTSDNPKHFVAEDAARRLIATGRIEVKS